MKNPRTSPVAERCVFQILVYYTLSLPHINHHNAGGASPRILFEVFDAEILRCTVVLGYQGREADSSYPFDGRA
jgi:hypothetical protein